LSQAFFSQLISDRTKKLKNKAFKENRGCGKLQAMSQPLVALILKVQEIPVIETG
jgi:hypothetical protein